MDEGADLQINVVGDDDNPQGEDGPSPNRRCEVAFKGIPRRIEGTLLPCFEDEIGGDDHHEDSTTDSARDADDKLDVVLEQEGDDTAGDGHEHGENEGGSGDLEGVLGHEVGDEHLHEVPPDGDGPDWDCRHAEEHVEADDEVGELDVRLVEHSVEVAVLVQVLEGDHGHQGDHKEYARGEQEPVSIHRPDRRLRGDRHVHLRDRVVHQEREHPNPEQIPELTRLPLSDVPVSTVVPVHHDASYHHRKHCDVPHDRNSSLNNSDRCHIFKRQGCCDRIEQNYPEVVFIQDHVPPEQHPKHSIIKSLTIAYFPRSLRS